MQKRRKRSKTPNRSLTPEIQRKLAGNPSTFTQQTFSAEEWAAMSELAQELKMENTPQQAVEAWIKSTVILPSGLLSDDEKVNLIQLVLQRLTEYTAKP